MWLSYASVSVSGYHESRLSGEVRGVCGDERTGVCVPFVLIMRALLFADELLIHDFLELDHCGGVVGLRVRSARKSLRDGEIVAVADARCEVGCACRR